jgi:uncharacterized repeat protein (TIGR01451 family)
MKRSRPLLVALALTTSVHAQAPLLEFNFDEGSGTTALNSGSIGAPANGGVSNAVFSGDTPTGSGTSLYLDGDTDYVAFPDTFDYGSAVTVEAWIKPEALNGQRAIYDDYGSPGVFLTIYDGRLQWNIVTPTHPGQGISIYAGFVCTGEWTHVAGTYDGATMRAYINGTQVGTLSTSGAILDNSGIRTTLGADNSTPNLLEFAGHIDDLRVWDVALTPDQLGGGLAISNNVSPCIDVSVAKIDLPDPVLTGDTLEYQFQILVRGGHPAANVVLTDILPASVNFGTFSSSQGTATFSAGTATWFLGTVTNNTYAYANLWVQPTVAGPLTNTVTVATSDVDVIPQNNSYTAITTVQPAGTDLTAELDAAFGTCVSTSKGPACPVDARLILRNGNLVYGDAVATLTNTCKTASLPPKCRFRGRLTVNELDLTGLPEHAIAFHLSSDSTLDDGDFLMKRISLSRALAAAVKGKSIKLRFKLPKGVDLTGQRILVVVNAPGKNGLDAVEESDETNNTAASPAIPPLP